MPERYQSSTRKFPYNLTPADKGAKRPIENAGLNSLRSPQSAGKVERKLTTPVRGSPSPAAKIAQEEKSSSPAIEDKKFYLKSDIMVLQRHITHLEVENASLKQENTLLKERMTNRENELVTSLQEENMSLSRTVVESNHQQEVMDTQLLELKNANESLLNQKTDLEEQLLNALRQLQADSETERALPLSQSARRTDIESIDWLQFTPIQAEVALELFYEFSCDGVITLEGFTRALIFAFATCFVSTELRGDPAVATELRNGVVGTGALVRGIPLDSIIFTQSFEFFDLDRDNKLDKHEFCCGLAKMSAGSFKDWAEYIFYITDVGGSGNLSMTQMQRFLHEFVLMFTALQINTVALLRSHLVRSGVPPEAIEAHLVSLEVNKAGAEALVEKSLDATFAALDTADQGRINFEEWITSRDKLPKIFTKVRFLCVGILTRNRPSFFEISQFMPEALDMSMVTSPQASLPRHFAPALASSGTQRNLANELDMLMREQKAGLRK